MSTIYVPKDSLGLMDMYFPASSSTSMILRTMRKSIFEEKKVDISESDKIDARNDIIKMGQKTDGSVPETHQVVNKYVFGENAAVRSIMLARGDFLREDEVIIKNTILSKDLGTNPWPLFQGRGGYDSIDTRVTSEQTLEYLQPYTQELRQMGVTHFSVIESSFYSFKDEDLKRNFRNGKGDIDFDDLVRYISDTYGFVGLKGGINKPTEQEYREKAIPFTSSRQKQSLFDKVIRELCQRTPYSGVGDVITDRGAIRIGFETEGEATLLGRVFEGSVKLDKYRFEARELHTDDYYSNPKKTGFKAFNIAMRVSLQKFRAIIMELQIYDLGMHRKAQIDENDPAYHGKLRDREEESVKKRKNILKQFGYDEVLRFILGTERLVVPLPKI